MSVPGTPNHYKTLLLAELLGLNRSYALGIMETLWHASMELADDGGVGRLTDAEIATAIYYDGDPAALVRCLCEARLLDSHEDHRLVVHNWERWRKQREEEYFRGESR